MAAIFRSPSTIQGHWCWSVCILESPLTHKLGPPTRQATAISGHHTQVASHTGTQPHSTQRAGISHKRLVPQRSHPENWIPQPMGWHQTQTGLYSPAASAQGRAGQPGTGLRDRLTYHMPTEVSPTTTQGSTQPAQGIS